MFTLLREKHQEWSLKLQEKINLMKSQDPNNPLIQTLEEQHRITYMNVLELGGSYNRKTAIDKIGAEMQKSASGSAINDIHNEFIQIIGVSNSSVGYLMFHTFWKNFSLNDRIKILHNVIDNIQNIMEHQDPVSGLKIAELILPTAAHSQESGIHRNVFNFLFQKSTMLDVVDENGDTALSIMVRQNIPSNVKKLLEKGASVAAPTKDLWFELLNNFFKYIALLDEFDIPTNTNGLYLLQNTQSYYETGNSVISSMVNNWVSNNHIFNPEENLGYITSADNAIKIIKLLSVYGLDVNGCVRTPLGDQTVFQRVCELRYGPIENTWMLKELMNIPSFDINAQHINGATAFMVACSKKSSITAIIASKENFDANLVDKTGHSQIHYLNNFTDINLAKNILDILVAKGADINSTTLDGNTPISFFLDNKKEELVEYLLMQYEVSLDIPTHNGLYPIHIAAANCSPRMIDLLISKGASLTQETLCTHKATPLVIAQKHFNVEMVDYLEECLSRNNLRTNDLMSGVYSDLKPQILACTENIANDPKNWEHYRNRGELFTRLGNFYGALKDYNKAIELDPNPSEIYDAKSSVLLALDRFQDALDNAELAISLNKDYYKAYSNKGAALRGLGRFEESIKAFDEGMSLGKSIKHGDLCHNKALVLMDLGRFQEALDLFNEAISLNASNVMYYNGKAQALIGLGLIQEANDCYDMVARINRSGTLVNNLNYGNMSYIDQNISMDRKELILKIQELQSLSIASLNSVANLDPSDPMVEVINKDNNESQDLMQRIYEALRNGSNGDEFMKLMEDMIDRRMETKDKVMIVRIERLESKVEEYNQAIISQLEQRLSDKQVDFKTIKKDLEKYQNHVSELESKISILQDGIASSNTSPDDLEKLRAQLSQYYQEMMVVKEDAASTVIALKELEPVCMRITEYLDEKDQREAEMKSIFSDPYKQSFYNHMVQQLNVVYLASSVVQSDIVSNNKSGTLGNAGSIMRFVGAYVPIIGFAVQLCGTVLSKIDSAQQKVIVQNLFQIANGPSEFNEIAEELSTILLKNDDISEILDFSTLNQPHTLAHKVQKILGGIAGSIFNNVGEISHFMHSSTTGKTQIAFGQVTKLLQDEINKFVIDVREVETNQDRMEGIMHGGMIASIIISRIYKGDASNLINTNDKSLKASTLLDFALDEYGLISQEIYTESEKVAFKVIEHFKTLSNLDNNYSEADQIFIGEVRDTLLQKTYYRKLLSKSMSDADICNDIALNIATKFSINKDDVNHKISEMISDVLVHSDFASRISVDDIVLLSGDSLASSLDG